MTFNIHFVFAAVAGVCGVLMLLGKRFSKWPLAAVAVICLAANELGILR